MSKEIVWLSVDPIRKKVDFYPSHIGNQIEEAFSCDNEKCVLGPQFFNATVHFRKDDDSGEARFFQTTPGQHLGRFSFKRPGFRSVARVVKKTDRVNVAAERAFGEWRISYDPAVHPNRVHCH